MFHFRTLSTLSIIMITLFLLLTFWLVAQSWQYEPMMDSLLSQVSVILIIAVSLPACKYLIQLILLPFYRKVETQRDKLANHPAASVSVLIPAYNEEVGIIKTVRSVIDNQFEALEIIIINDGSTDNTDKIIRQFLCEPAHHKGRTVRYLSIENGGKANALNQGLKRVNHEIVLTIDADCIMDSNCISNTVARFNDANVGAVAGNIIVANHRKPLAIIQQLEYLFGFFLRRADSILNSVLIIGGAAAAYRKSTLDKVGPFNPDVVTEDIDMAVRILAAGYHTRYAHDAITYTEAPESWRDLCKQRLRWKFGRLQTFFRYRSQFFTRRAGVNRYFSWVQLPLALYAECLLMFQVFIVGLLIYFAIYNQFFTPFIGAAIILFIICLLMMLSQTTKRRQRHLVLFAPIAWLCFLVVDICEWQALIRSIKRLVLKRGVQWQKWRRIGI